MSGQISIHETFRAFVETELLPDLGLQASDFWRELQALIEALTPENREVLAIRDELQSRIDAFHREHADRAWDAATYRAFLVDIGYLEERLEPFRIQTANVDPEIASVAGPQLVVPVNNARFALNAANARWSSLYDALYGTDVIPVSEGREASGPYNPKRGDSVIEYAARFLDAAAPLKAGSHADATEYRLQGTDAGTSLVVVLKDGTETGLRDAARFAGSSSRGSKRIVLLRNNGLHIEIQLDPEHPIGKQSAADVCDIVLESAVTTIQDCEDSVAAVDAADKVTVYRNWLGLMRGTLSATFDKGGKSLTRELNPDRQYEAADGGTLTLPGRSLMLVRNVGHLMTTDAVLDTNGDEVFEGILDAVITTACALYDLRGKERLSNSRSGSVYIVKPKMHGSREAAFADSLFTHVEDMFGLDRNTIKVGVMDEERRTSVNLEECIRQVKDRLVFINTGFLDRTGDEIHTSMLAGPMLPKDASRSSPGFTPTRIATSMSASLRLARACADRQGHVGKARRDARNGRDQTGASRSWRELRLGAFADGGHAARDALSRSRCRSQAEGTGVREMASLDDILTPPLGDRVS